MRSPDKPALRTTVLINNYNNGTYLEACLDSVLQQSPPADEIIVFDDGSTDGSLAILARYRDRVVVIASPHGAGTALQNQAHAIEAAFRVSVGDIIFLLDSDDLFLPGKIAATLEVFARQPTTVLVQAPLEKIDDAGRPLGIEFEPARHQSDYLAHIYSAHELNVYYPTSALAFSRAYLEQRFPLDTSDGLHVWADARLALPASHFGDVVALSRPYTKWRRHARSHTVTKSLPVYRLVRLNHAYFNAFCRATGRPPLRPWRSAHHWKRTIRHYFFPDTLVEWYRIMRWATLSEGKKRQMLRGVQAVDIEQELDRAKR